MPWSDTNYFPAMENHAKQTVSVPTERHILMRMAKVRFNLATLDIPKLSIRVGLLLGLIFANLLVFSVVSFWQFQSRQNYEERTRVVTQNIAKALDQNVSKNVASIDLGIRAVVDELERQLASGGIDEKATSEFIARYESRLPAVEAFRIAQEDGTVILGKGVDKTHPVSWRDRDYFIHLRDSTADELDMRKPRQGRVAKQPIVNFARRYNYPNGRFAGVVSAPVAVTHFSELLSSFSIGANSSLILRDAELGLIARVPAIPDSPAGQIGNNAVSQEFKKIVASGVVSATYSTLRGADGLERIATFRRLADVPLIAVVAAASVDYLADWRVEVFKSGALSLVFFLLSLITWWWLRGFLLQAQQRQAALNANEEKLRTLFELSPLGISLTSMEGALVEFNKAFMCICGYSEAELKSLKAFELTPEKYALDEAQQLNSLNTIGKYGPYEKEYRRKDGSLIPVQLNGICVTGAQGQKHVWSFVEDISERKLQESQLSQARVEAEAAEQFSRSTLDTVPENICVLDRAGVIIEVNQAWRDFYDANYPDPGSVDYAIGANYLDVCEAATGANAREASRMAEGLASVLAGERELFSIEYPCDSLTEKRYFFARVKRFSGDSGHVLVAHGNITERKMLELELARMARTDVLTGLNNRRSFMKLAETELSRTARYAGSMSVLMLDIDHFKRINDTHGHQVGDRVIQRLAALCQETLRDLDVIGRLGGEEFAVTMPSTGHSDAMVVAERLREAIEAGCVVLPQGLPLRFTVSIGVTTVAQEGNLDTLLDQADKALYKAKNSGRNRVCSFLEMNQDKA